MSQKRRDKMSKEMVADDDKLKEASHQTMVGIIVLYERVV